jgi:hypothetical protein
MGKFMDKFKSVGKKINNNANKFSNREKHNNRGFLHGRQVEKNKEVIGEGLYDDDEGTDKEFDESINKQHYDGDEYGVGIQTAQKPRSFHEFILENQYKDLEKSIRGYKDVYNKTTREWETKRKETHCFTDEEAEEILRTAQSHLATDIKLSFINVEVFGDMMMAIYKRLDGLFYSIAEYRYGRYGAYNIQYNMKLQNQKIFLELWTRVQANYSRAIQGAENKATHDSVRGQESLQGDNQDDYEGRGRGY